MTYKELGEAISNMTLSQLAQKVKYVNVEFSCIDEAAALKKITSIFTFDDLEGNEESGQLYLK